MRIGLICPGRGSYARTELGSLTAPRPGLDPRRQADLIEQADARREGLGLATITELDSAEHFGSRHLAGENAAALISVGAALDLAALDAEHEIVAVCGNSMGWYIALHAAGCLEFADALELCDTMGGQQRHGVVGGQLLWPLVDEDWRRDPARALELERGYEAARRGGGQAWPSIHLGGFAVVAGDEEGLAAIERELPALELGRRQYPFRLLGHSAFHTPLLAETAQRGRIALDELPIRPPSVPLIDGRGHAFRPLTASADDIFDYTLGAQVVSPYDFTASVRVVLREYAPDALVLLGPGESLGGAIGQILVSEGWRGIDSKAAFLDRQRTDSPPLIAMGRAEQRPAVVSGLA